MESLLRRAAAEAVLPHFTRLNADDIREKTPGELVTVADDLSERVITAGLLEILPESVVVGEEAVASDPALLSRLSADEWVWVVDPLDGTRNFVEGHGPIGLLVALIHHSEVVASCMLDPLSGVAATAESGAGAYLAGSRVYAPAGVPDAPLRGAVLTRYLPPELRSSVEEREESFGGFLPGFGCAGHEYPEIVRGEQHFALFWRTLPWDHLPGAFFLTEAGGVALRLDGSHYRVAEDRKGLLVAGNREIWEMARRGLFGEADIPGI